MMHPHNRRLANNDRARPGRGTLPPRPSAAARPRPAAEPATGHAGHPVIVSTIASTPAPISPPRVPSPVIAGAQELVPVPPLVEPDKAPAGRVEQDCPVDVVPPTFVDRTVQAQRSQPVVQVADLASRAVRAWFRDFRRTRPFWGSLWLGLSGWWILHYSLMGIQVAVSTSFLAAGSWVTGGGMIVCAVFGLLSPSQRTAVGFIGTVLAVASLVASNFGGLLVGMIGGIIGGTMMMAWGPKHSRRSERSAADATATDEAQDLQDLGALV